MGHEVNICRPHRQLSAISWLAYLCQALWAFPWRYADLRFQRQQRAHGLYSRPGGLRQQPALLENFPTASPSMDILISSNLERLLYQLSGSDAEVRDYMDHLNREGKYTVSETLRQKIQESFAAGWRSDQRAAETIARVFGCEGYLMDTHTAVAYTVLEDHRKQTGDKTLTVVLSTASPYKFCSSVLEALGVEELQPGTEIIGQLEQKTNTTAPAPLKQLASQQVRFHQVTEKSGMQDVVLEMLS